MCGHLTRNSVGSLLGIVFAIACGCGVHRTKEESGRDEPKIVPHHLSRGSEDEVPISPPSPVRPTPPPRVPDRTDGVFGVAAARRALGNFHVKCMASGGLWNAGMIQCECPDNKIFFTERGCVEVEVGPFEPAFRKLDGHDRLTLKGGMREESVASVVSIDFSGCDHAVALAAKLNVDPLQIYRGSIFPDMTNDVPWDIDVGEIKELQFSYLTLGFTSSRYPFNGEFKIAGAFFPQTDHPGKEESVTQCADAVVGILGPTCSRDDVTYVCRGLFEELSRLTDSDRQPYSVTDSGSNCSAECQQVAIGNDGQFGAFTRIAMTHHIPYARAVSAFGPNGHEVDAYVASNGRIQGVAWNWSRPLYEMSEPIGLTYDYLELDYSWTLLNRETGKTRADAMDKIRKRKTSGVNTGHDKRGSGLHVAVFESSISLEDDRIASQYNVMASGAANRLLGEWMAPDCGESCKRDIGALDSSGWSIPFGGEHGNSVAQIFLEGLPGVEFINIDVAPWNIYGAHPRVTAGVSETLKKYRPKVVNFSIILRASSGECENTIGKLLDAHPDVLFIAAVGNDGLRNADGLCPASLWRTHPNLLTVAASEPDGSLSNYSTRGPEIAMVAAVGNTMIEIGAGESKTVMPLTGTSLAAPRVGNLALKMLVKNPSLSAVDLIDRIMANCEPGGIDVQCGGQITEAALGRAGYLP